MQIDHVNGGGKADRVEFRSDMLRYYRVITEKVLSGIKDYREA